MPKPKKILVSFIFPPFTLLCLEHDCCWCTRAYTYIIFPSSSDGPGFRSSAKPFTPGQTHHALPHGHHQQQQQQAPPHHHQQAQQQQPPQPHQDDSEESGVGHEEEEELQQLLVELLSNIRTPGVSEVAARSALLSWGPPVRHDAAAGQAQAGTDGTSKFDALEPINDDDYRSVDY